MFGSQAEPRVSVLSSVNFGVASRAKGFGSGETDATLTLLDARAAAAKGHTVLPVVKVQRGDAARHVDEGQQPQEEARRVGRVLDRGDGRRGEIACG